MVTSNSLKLGLIGYPLDHSFSPAIHGAALDYYDLVGDYHLYPILPLPEGVDRMQNVLMSLRSGEIKGLNVTIPHKQVIMPYLDRNTPAAEEIGAVNTIYTDNELLVGDNTDVNGFFIDFEQIAHRHSPALLESVDVENKRVALVLGAGGAARAVVYSLITRGWKVIVCARRREQADSILRRLGKHAGSDDLLTLPYQKASLDSVRTSIKLLVNATPLGMTPDIVSSPWPEELALPKGAIVYDLVYNPPDTQLIRKARKEGLVNAGGIGMLIEQAALSFERWTGKPAPRKVMFKAVRGNLPDKL